MPLSDRKGIRRKEVPKFICLHTTGEIGASGYNIYMQREALIIASAISRRLNFVDKVLNCCCTMSENRIFVNIHIVRTRGRVVFNQYVMDEQ